MSTALVLAAGLRVDLLRRVTLVCRTPLMLAVVGGHVDAVSLLLEREANVNTADKKGLMALHLAVRTPELR